MDKLHVFWHEGMLIHNLGQGVFDTLHDPGFLEVLEKHPENADRVRNMLSILKKGPIGPCIHWHTGRPAILHELHSFHTPEEEDEILRRGKVVKRGEEALVCDLQPTSNYEEDKNQSTCSPKEDMTKSSLQLNEDNDKRDSPIEATNEEHLKIEEDTAMGVVKPAMLDQLHEEYVNMLIEADAAGGKTLCGGTRLNPGSWEAALLAAGTTLKAMQYILDGHGKLCYALVRPPGHHAQPNQADGYCFLNNAGLAVRLALQSSCKRVAVVDIDVHYGNGTAEGFYEQDDVLTISLHMNHGSWGPSHPQSGLHDEIGQGNGRGFNLNIPLPNGTGDRGYEHAMHELVVPAISKFKPEMIVFVIGQDSSAFDPNGRQCLTMSGYKRIGQIMRQQADQFSGGCLLVVQEGGYHLTYASYCLHAILEGVLNLTQPLLTDPMAYYPEEDTYSERIEFIKKYRKEVSESCLKESTAS